MLTLAALVVAFFLGVLFTLLAVASAWLYTAPMAVREKADHMPPFRPASLPETLREALSGDDEVVSVESCRWFNLIAAFLFQELRDTPRVKNFILAKIHQEFNDLMFTRREGRMLEQMTVRDYDLGTSLPLFTHAVIQERKYSCSDGGELEEASISVHVDYCGGFWIGIDADLVFNRVAYVAIRVIKVKGYGRLQFTTQPCTHWSFAFYEEPELVLEVESTFEGRSFPQLGSFIEAQVRRWVRQKHTLPACKTRFKPFFVKPRPQSQLNELYVHNERVTVGRLYVEVLKCSKLLHPPSAVGTFCTLSTSSLPWQPLLGMWRSRWAEHEFSVRVNDPAATVGICYRLVVEWEGREGRNEFVMITEVLKDSLAAHTGVRRGDIITRVNNVKVHSVTQVRKVINKTKQGSILLAVKRPPKHISEHMLHGARPTRLATPTPKRTTTVADTTSGIHSDGEGDDGGRSDSVRRGEWDGDSIGLCGVRGERTLNLDPRSQSSGPVSLEDRISVNDATPPTMLTPLPRATRNVEEEETVHQTEDVEVCRAPRWVKREFKFSVGSQQCYLNVCVYDRLASEDKGELLIGHVTVPLMDVALECLALSCARHLQRYVLVAPEIPRATSSRAVHQASEGRRGVRGKGRGEEDNEGKRFVGSILLRFRHSPHRGAERQLEGEEEEEERVDGEETHLAAEEEGGDPTHTQPQDSARHQFHAKELEGAHRCHICHKRVAGLQIWALKGRVQICVRCGAQCHKRCVAQCQRAVPCGLGIDALQSHEAQGFQVYEDARRGERAGEVEGEDRGWMEHRSLQQQTTEDVPPADSDIVRVRERDEEREEEVGGGRGSWETPAELGEEDRDGEESAGSENIELSSEDERLSCNSSSDNESSGEETELMLAELTYQMFSHLPEPERAAAMHSKVVALEAEVERAEQLVRGTQAQLNHGHGNQESLKRQLRQHKEKLQPLQLMRRQYSLALHQMTTSCHGD